MFFGITIILIIQKGKVNKQSIISMIKLVAIGGIASLSNVLFIKMVQMLGIANITNRTETLSINMLISNIEEVLKMAGYWILETYGLLPKGCLLLILVVTYIIFLLWNILYVKSIKNTLFYIFLIVLSFGCVLAPHFLTTSLWMAQRTIASFLAIVSIPYIIIVTSNNDCHRLCQIGAFVLGILMLVNIVKIQSISVNVISKNRIDAEIAYNVQAEIENYQNDTGILVENICVLRDANITWGYKTTNYVVLDTNSKAFAIDWAAVNCINFYNGTNYKKVEPDLQIKEEIASKNWDSLNLSEQMKFVDNTVYLAVY